MEEQRKSRVSFSHILRESIIGKMAFMGIIIILLMIPISMVQRLVSERQSLKDGAKREVSEKWGRAQVVSGPIIMVPYRESYEKTNGELIETIKILHILPESLDIAGDVKNETRNRNQFEVMLYKSNLHLKGEFVLPNWSNLQLSAKQVLWDRAWVSIGISDNTGIKSQTKIKLGANTYALESGSEAPKLMSNGLHSKIKLKSDEQIIPFEFDLDLQGTDYIGFTPVGKETTVKIASPWKDPSFKGNFLRESYTPSEQGFTATWKIYDLNRNFPQTWLGDKYDFDRSDFGVSLIKKVDEYHLNYRSGKYALFVIALTFLIFFFFEVLGKHQLHPFQYLLIGLAISIFYLLLLSFSEQVGFKRAYVIAASATIGLIVLYSKFILQSFQQAGLLGLLLTIIYGFIYVVLQLEDLALLVGSIGLFLVLAAVMYLSRNVNWFGDKERN